MALARLLYIRHSLSSIICFVLIGQTSSCAEPLTPVYNEEQNQYLSCNAWEPVCPAESKCALADLAWKARHQISPSYFLFLCCWNKTSGSEGKHVKPLEPPGPQTEPTTTANSTESDFNPVIQIQDSQRVMLTNKLQPFEPMFPSQTLVKLHGNGGLQQPEQYSRIVPLIVGHLDKPKADGTFRMWGSSTLVQDSGYNIVVDTSSASQRNALIGALAQQGINPQNIHLVVYTHAHPAHSANDNVFPYAQKIYSTFIYKNLDWFSAKQLEEPKARLTQNVELWQTPGRSYFHNSIIVRNVGENGSIIISGNVFLNQDTFNSPNDWKIFAVDNDPLVQTRNMLLCQGDMILPAYGSMFRSPTEQKMLHKC